MSTTEGLLLAFSTMLIPDIDYALYWHKHRVSPFHTPAFGLAVFLCGFFFQPLFLVGIGILLHLLLDSIDYGIMWLYPFSKKIYGLQLLHYDPRNFPTKTGRVAYDIKVHFSNKWMLAITVAFILALAWLVFVL